MAHFLTTQMKQKRKWISIIERTLTFAKRDTDIWSCNVQQCTIVIDKA
jgi:hypothetical protein